jgi:hypothetical protein
LANDGHGAALISTSTVAVLENKGNCERFIYFYLDGVVLHVMRWTSLADRSGRDESSSFLDAQPDETRTYSIIRQIKLTEMRTRMQPMPT